MSGVYFQGGTANQPPVLGAIGAYIPPIRVPGTLGTYPGPVPTDVTTVIPSAQKMVASIPIAERRRAFTGQASKVASVALARASTNARKIVGAIPRPR